MKRPIKQRMRTLIQNSGAWFWSVAWNHFSAEPSGRICWKDRMRWWLEGIGDTIFFAGYSGSDEELLAVENGEIPLDCMNERQRAELDRYDPKSWPFSCHQPGCGWHGNLTDTRDEHCPLCGGSVCVYFRPDNRVPIALIPEHCGAAVGGAA